MIFLSLNPMLYQSAYAQAPCAVDPVGVWGLRYTVALLDISALVSTAAFCVFSGYFFWLSFFSYCFS